ncbi:restriction endonuclease subunit S [Xanthomonas arboricola]|uniref:restriction endonuclease subunit S n=1 Tax=Xanthomonas arboricola TaxID=56448 RepID=UPI0015E3675C|nr:restriction endonuclease subunit S [Xanthomonas arboricola]
MRPLRELASIRSGIAKNSKATVSDPIRVHYLRVANVQDGFLDLTDMSCIEVSRGDINRFSVLPGDVLMNEGGDLDKLGRGSIWRGEFQPCIHQNHVFVVRCGSSISPEYLTIWSSGATARRYFLVAGKQTTNLASINKKSLGELPVVLPSQNEQCAISTALSDVDTLLEGLDRLIAKKRDIKQSAMQQLLTGQSRLPGFSGEWNVKLLGDVAEVKTGPFGSLLHERDYVSDGVPIITVEHLGEFGVEHVNLPMVSEADCKRLNAYSLHVGDIVFSRVGSVDRNALIRKLEDGWLFSGRLLRVRPNESCINSMFLSYQFHSEKFKLAVRTVAVGQTMASLNTRILNGIQVNLPSISEQTAIATILSDMDAEITVLETRRIKTRALKQAMMQELLTGRTRLI